MLQCSGYIPTTAGSAFVPGEAGKPPEFVGSGYRVDSYVMSVPQESYATAITPVLCPALEYPPYAGSTHYAADHGFDQRIQWDSRYILSGDHVYSGDSTHPTFPDTVVGTGYRRWNFSENITSSSYVNVLPRYTSYCYIGDTLHVFQATSISYSTISTAFTHFINVVRVPVGIDTDVSSYMKVGIGTSSLFSKSLTDHFKTTGTPGTGFYIQYSDARLTENRQGGGWSASSIVTPDNLDELTTLNYRHTLYFSRQSDTAGVSSYDQISKTLSPMIDSDIGHLPITASVYGNLWRV